MPETINIIDSSLKDYQSALALQENAHLELLQGSGKDTIFIVEHLPVITLGARTSSNKLTKDAEEIKKAGVEIFQIRRGGGATAHNPGQLVIYPVINLKKRSLGVSDFVHLLERIGIEFLSELGVHACTKKGYPGLWIEDEKPRINTNEHEFKTNFLNSVNPRSSVSEINSVNPHESASENNSVNPRESASENNSVNPRSSASEINSVNPCPWLKIASIGVQIKKWITFHGIAININNDLGIFDLIIPCGLDNVKMTSVEKELGKKIDMETAKNSIKRLLLKYFINGSAS